MSLPGLRASEFGAFFRAIHGCDPFPWQLKLAQEVTSNGWPTALDVPTGAGKTAAIDVGVFHLALEADRGGARRAPVRILFVVDRRLVVDDAFSRAKTIGRALSRAGEKRVDDDVLHRAARRLGGLAEDLATPLQCARLRGGVPKEPDWLRTPSQPTVVVSTVDQVGSRLLFRGYGVSDRMKSLHAGLLGCDALLLLDEAHLSQPFFATLRDLGLHAPDGEWNGTEARTPFSFVSLSATQTNHAPPLLTDADRCHEILGARLKASKPAVLVRADTASSAEFEAEFVNRSWSLCTRGGGTAGVVAVVVNRVRRARAVFDGLRRKICKYDDVDLVLLTGRSREISRERILREVLPRMRSGRSDGEQRALLVVATQCVEAGADLDFDALVTEVAPLDALRQRFGRLNRSGRAIPANAFIIAASKEVSKSAEVDPVYGAALARTWELLERNAVSRGKGRNAERVVDFGIEAAQAWLPSADKLDELCVLAPRDEAPVLLPRDVHLWRQTSPAPEVDPEVPLYLHGKRPTAPDVQVVWRADLDPEINPRDWMPWVVACPPASSETLAVPIHEARRWLDGAANGDVTDLEASPNDAREEPTRLDRDRRALCWRGPEDPRTRAVRSVDLRPGDTIVVPAAWGGCDRWGWHPASRDTVEDLGDEAYEKARGRKMVRVSWRLWESRLRLRGLDEASVQRVVARINAATSEASDVVDSEVATRLRDVRELAASLDQMPPYVIHRNDQGVPMALVARRASRRERDGAGDATTEDDESSRSPGPQVTLQDHSRDVSDFARRFATGLGLPPDLVEDVALAAYLHDAGKAHPAFKQWLYGGDELAAIAGPALAKSGVAVLGDHARVRAGLPRGARHEVASLAFAEGHPRMRKARDPALVLWLIGTHHGYGRPFFPSVTWPSPREEPFDADLGDGVVRAHTPRPLPELTATWIELFEILNAKYGTWGLARLEAIVRLADHRASEAESEEGHG